MRFTLKVLFAAIAVAALICGLFFAVPGWLSLIILGLVLLLSPPVLIGGIVYGRGYVRAFFIGCISTGGCLPLIYLYGLVAIASGGLEWPIEMDDGSVLGVQIAFAVVSVLVGLSGMTAMGVRWLSLRVMSKDDKPQTSSPPEYSVLHGRVATVQMESTPVEPERQQSLSAQ